MTQTIYLDVLLAINLFVNYLLLLSVSSFLHLRARREKMAAGAALGAVCSLIILLPQLPVPLLLAVRLLLSCSMVLLSFPRTNLRGFLRAAACFYLTGFAFAGFLAALWYLVSPQGMLLRNSVVYFDVSPLFLLSAAVFCYFMIKLLNGFSGRRADTEVFCTAEVFAQNRRVKLTAKVDTGNSLSEPFSHYPVIVAEYKAVEPILPQALFSFFSEAGPPRPGEKIRMVPFRAVGTQGVLPAFRPKKVILRTGKSAVELSDVYLAVSRERLSASFDALLNPDLLTQGIQRNRKENPYEDEITSRTPPKVEKPSEKSPEPRAPVFAAPDRGALLHQRPRNTAAASDQGGGSRGDEKYSGGKGKRTGTAYHP